MKTDVLTWCQDLTAYRADATACGAFYDDVILMLAGTREQVWFGHFTLTAMALDEEIKQVPDDCVRIYAVFYDDVMLSLESKNAMEALDPTWRNRRHTPVAYIVDDVEERYIRIWPPSDIDCEELGWLYTQRLTDAPPIMDLPLTLFTLAREYSRESNHRDLPFAQLCQAFGLQLLAMVAP